MLQTWQIIFTCVFDDFIMSLGESVFVLLHIKLLNSKDAKEFLKQNAHSLSLHSCLDAQNAHPSPSVTMRLGDLEILCWMHLRPKSAQTGRPKPTLWNQRSKIKHYLLVRGLLH